MLTDEGPEIVTVQINDNHGHIDIHLPEGHIGSEDASEDHAPGRTEWDGGGFTIPEGVDPIEAGLEEENPPGPDDRKLDPDPRDLIQQAMAMLRHAERLLEERDRQHE